MLNSNVAAVCLRAYPNGEYNIYETNEEKERKRYEL